MTFTGARFHKRYKPQPSSTKISMKIISQIFHLNLPGVKELTINSPNKASITPNLDVTPTPDDVNIIYRTKYNTKQLIYDFQQYQNSLNFVKQSTRSRKFSTRRRMVGYEIHGFHGNTAYVVAEVAAADIETRGCLGSISKDARYVASSSNRREGSNK